MRLPIYKGREYSVYRQRQLSGMQGLWDLPPGWVWWRGGKDGGHTIWRSHFEIQSQVKGQLSRAREGTKSYRGRRNWELRRLPSLRRVPRGTSHSIATGRNHDRRGGGTRGGKGKGGIGMRKRCSNRAKKRRRPAPSTTERTNGTARSDKQLDKQAPLLSPKGPFWGAKAVKGLDCTMFSAGGRDSPRSWQRG